MALLWNDVKNWLTDATKSAIKDAEDLTRKGKLKFEMLNLNRKLEKTFAELGGVVYHVLESGKSRPKGSGRPGRSEPGRTRQDKSQPDLSQHAEIRLLAGRIRRLEARLRATRRQWKKKR